MKVFADLHLHSKYSRAVSPKMEPKTMAEWAAKKGINLLATGDWTHPLWLKELEANLKETSSGIYQLKEAEDRIKKIRFILSTEISSIYSQSGKTRRIHNLVMAPSLKTVHKINQELKRRHCNLMSDGRPIIGLSSIQLAELVWSIDKHCLIIPAHCLLPQEQVHIQDFKLKSIEKITTGDKVFTHKNRWQKVTEIFKREYKGQIYHVISDYFHPGIRVTREHPFYAIKTKKGCCSISKTLGVCKPLCKQSCSRKYYKKYKPEWILAENLEIGDILLYPRYKKVINKKFINIDKILSRNKKGKEKQLPDKIQINKNFCRLIGYFLAEGYTNGRDNIGFCFNVKEREYVEDIKKVFKEEFNWDVFREYRRKGSNGLELLIDSKQLYQLMDELFFVKGQRKTAGYKKLPEWALSLDPKLQKEIFLGWWRGDKGYTTSRLLINQFKIICLRLGIIPSIHIDTIQQERKRGKCKIKNRIIKANFDLFSLSHLCFFEEKYGLSSKKEFKKFKRKMNRTRGWMDKNFVYLPIRRIVKEDYSGFVYNLEVEKDNSYTTEFALVHNCWTPWFAMFGSKSGFDSIKECWGEFSDRIYAIETGLSSDPEMNWRIKELDNRAIVSFSDAHSPAKLGRELTVLEPKTKNEKIKAKSFSFNDLALAIKQDKNSDWKIAYTIEFYPEEGKYHFSGHRKCGIRQSPEQTKKKGAGCPVCGKTLTLGVMHRVEELASYPAIKPLKKQNKNGLVGYYHPTNKKRPPYVKLVPLMEIIAEVMNVASTSKKVQLEYENITKNLAPEIEILTQTKLEKINQFSSPRLAEAIDKVRQGNIVVEPGFDGVFGTVKIWPLEKKSAVDEALANQKEQISLF